MSVQIAIDERGGFMRVTLTGALGFEAYVESFEALVSHASYRPGVNALWDFREAPLAGLPTETLRRIIRFSAERRELRRGARVAIVVSSDADFGVARIFEAVAADLPIQFQVFRDIGEAEVWVGGPHPE
jgi:hypothetical protein